MVIVGKKIKESKLVFIFQIDTAADGNQIEVTNGLYFTKSNFFFSIILLALPASCYHSLLPETLSSLGFESSKFLLYFLYHSALLVLPLLLELSLNASIGQGLK